MSHLCRVAALLLLCTAAPLAQAGSDTARLVGTYRLVSMTSTDAQGSLHYPLGKGVTGMLARHEVTHHLAGAMLPN